MDIVIIAQYLRNIENFDGNNSRFVYIAKELAKNNNVEIITSDFSHAKKEKFNRIGNLSNVKITACHESGYSKNVCLKRFTSHKELAINIKKYLEKRDKPDVVYAAVPSLAVAKICADYCKKNKVRFIIDVQDLWPEAFKMVFNIPALSNLLFYPMKRQADYIYSQADDIVAVSNTYASRAVSVNKKYNNKLSVFLGTDLDFFDKCKEENIYFYDDNKLRLVYIGTLGHSYDLKCIMDAMIILKNKGIQDIAFEIIGDGPMRDEFEKYAKENKVDCEFTGRLDYEVMIGRLCACDIAVNPIKKNSAGSIINKVGDYAAAGLPVINTQESEEYKKIISDYKAGFNCENGNACDIANKIENLYNDINLRKEMGQGNRDLAKERFDRQKTYRKIVKLIGE